MLPETVDAVENKITVLSDSGIRKRCVSVPTACSEDGCLCMGWFWQGNQDARSVVKSFLADLDQSMVLAGMRTIADCHRGMIRKV